MGILQDWETIKQETNKLQNMLNDKEIEHLNDATSSIFSNCCGALIIMGKCSDCKEPASPAEPSAEEKKEFFEEVEHFECIKHFKNCKKCQEEIQELFANR